MPKDPNWTKDEHILALDLYFRFPEARNSKTHPELLKLSQILRQLPIYSKSEVTQSYRNPNSVGMKLSNFKRFDPNYSGIGLKRGSQKEEEVWKEFAYDQEILRRTAEAITQNSQNFIDLDIFNEIDEDYEAQEGKILTITHRIRERDKSIIIAKKQSILSNLGCLKCEACGFDFQKTYGEIGEGFAECHHEKPISELVPGEKTLLKDLRIVCSNCHRMIHRRKPWLSLEELRNILSRKFS